VRRIAGVGAFVELAAVPTAVHPIRSLPGRRPRETIDAYKNGTLKQGKQKDKAVKNEA